MLLTHGGDVDAAQHAQVLAAVMRAERLCDRHQEAVEVVELSLLVSKTVCRDVHQVERTPDLEESLRSTRLVAHLRGRKDNEVLHLRLSGLANKVCRLVLLHDGAGVEGEEQPGYSQQYGCSQQPPVRPLARGMAASFGAQLGKDKVQGTGCRVHGMGYMVQGAGPPVDKYS